MVPEASELLKLPFGQIQDGGRHPNWIHLNRKLRRWLFDFAEIWYDVGSGRIGPRRFRNCWICRLVHYGPRIIKAENH